MRWGFGFTHPCALVRAIFYLQGVIMTSNNPFTTVNQLERDMLKKLVNNKSVLLKEVSMFEFDQRDYNREGVVAAIRSNEKYKPILSGMLCSIHHNFTHLQMELVPWSNSERKHLPKEQFMYAFDVAFISYWWFKNHSAFCLVFLDRDSSMWRVLRFDSVQLTTIW